MTSVCSRACSARSLCSTNGRPGLQWGGLLQLRAPFRFGTPESIAVKENSPWMSGRPVMLWTVSYSCSRPSTAELSLY